MKFLLLHYVDETTEMGAEEIREDRALLDVLAGRHHRARREPAGELPAAVAERRDGTRARW